MLVVPLLIERNNMEENEIVKLIRQNDNAAYQQLFEAYYKKTYAVAYNILRRRENAEDITQDSFIKAFQNLHQLKDASKFGAWLAVIASNRARNYLKREKRIILTDEQPHQSYQGSNSHTEGAEDTALQNIEMDKVRLAIKKLSPDYYQVIVLQYYHDLKVEEIADMLQIKIGTVKSRLFRARQRLAEMLELDEASNCLKGKGEGGGAEYGTRK